jgi:squalene monooxygenase
VLKVGCFRYFERGGECVQGPVSLLSALGPSRFKLFYHFFSVAIYSIYLMFAAKSASVLQWPQLTMRGASVVRLICPAVLCAPSHNMQFWTACLVFLPVLWHEI